ncbi:MAG TPA: tRNA (adenosine(37)-N6)-threonylcarbamoyltransferase complex transferase subunit TsaD [Thermodesulfovibrionales bacterium]|jgi:N6-L-threonylcarbamoyladenine synthase|nr:tRNA (adenosine(37)-N6)-threonylcarbamoyltransferase complex transferase subunit TsaD [Thermodesulfovibrionales bacterium]
MLILGIDTSCDDTSAAVVGDGSRIISNIVSSQEFIHKKYGGIVPELASRRHIEMIWPVVDEALKSAQTGLDGIVAVAVCHGPGLIGSLLVGCSFAKALCFSRDIPLVAVNHLEGHVFSCFLEERRPQFPFLSLIVSGGHTSLYRVEGFGGYRELGRTRDDAAGEAYDKVSKLLGLGYPGGPVIDKLAQDGDPGAVDFPRAYLPESLDFSFSGLKTAVVNYMRHGRQVPLNDFCASFQQAVVDVLVRKTEWAIRQTGIRTVTLAGGVAANSGLRERFRSMAEKGNVEIFAPSVRLCTDNAAMIAAAGYHRYLSRDFAGLDLNPAAYLPL